MCTIFNISAIGQTLRKVYPVPKAQMPISETTHVPSDQIEVL